MSPLSRILTFLPALIAGPAITARGEMLFSSNFDGNTGATVLTGNTDNVAGSAAVSITDWVTSAAVTSISGLTAVSTDAGTPAGGFAQLQNGAATYANGNNIFLSRNAFNQGTAPRIRGFSLTFTLGAAKDLETLTVMAGHTANSGNQDQSYASDLVFTLSGGSLPAPVTAASREDYATAPAYHTVSFDLAGTALAAGSYTLEVYQTAASGGCYAIYNGITLSAVSPFIDTDGDGLEDAWEQTIIDFDPADAVTSLADVMGTGASPAVTDFDHDGSADAAEPARGTSPVNPDTDGDGFYDGAESGTGVFVSYRYDTNTGDTGTDPLNPDSDGDSLRDGVESGTGIFVSASDTGTNPNTSDTDADTLTDAWEIAHGLNPNADSPPDGGTDDPDGDGLLNAEEQDHGTDPHLADTDGDGVSDTDELFTDNTNPLAADSDGDGLSDGQEKAAGTDPRDADSDDDLFSDGAELAAGSDPRQASSIPAATLFSSTFDLNTGAAVLDGSADNISGSATVQVTWLRRAEVSDVSSLTAICTGDSGTLGGFAQLQSGTAPFANENNLFISRNFNLDTDRTTSRRGYQLTFTVDSPVALGQLIVISGHTNNGASQDQSYASDLVYVITGGTLAAPLTAVTREDYAIAPAYHSVTFDLGGAAIGAGSYTLEIYQTRMTDGGAYAMYDGLALLAAGGPPVVPGGVQIVHAGFNGAAFEMQVTGLDAARQYVLMRSANLADGFPVIIGGAVSPASPAATFTDPAPSGTKAFYRIGVLP